MRWHKTTNSRNTHPSPLPGPSSVHPLCTTDCLQQVGLGVPPKHHLSLHFPTTFCFLHGGGWQERCVKTPSRYLQPPPAMRDPTEQDSCIMCTKLCNTKYWYKYRTANTYLCTTNQIVSSVNVAAIQWQGYSRQDKDVSTLKRTSLEKFEATLCKFRSYFVRTSKLLN